MSIATTVIDASEVPGWDRGPKGNSKWDAAITQAMILSIGHVLEISNFGTSVPSARTGICHRIKKRNAPVRVINRKGRVFLAPMGTEAS